MSYLKLNDNVSIYYQLAGDGLPVILIHGWGMNSSIWTLLFRELSQTYKVFVPDLRGHGRSSDACGPYTFEQLTDDLRVFIDTLEIVNPVIVGWSMGSMITLKYVLRFPYKASGLVLVGSTHKFIASSRFPSGRHPAMIRRMRINLERDYKNYIKDFCGHFFYTQEKISPITEKKIVEMMFENGFPPPFKVVIQTLEELSAWDISDSIGKINIPALIIHGEIDNIISVDAAKEMNHMIPGSYLSIFEKTGHAPFLTAQKRFNDELKKFIKKVSKI